MIRELEDWEIRVSPEDDPGVMVSIMMSYRAWGVIRKLAQKEGMSPGLWIREALRKVIREEEGSTPAE